MTWAQLRQRELANARRRFQLTSDDELIELVSDLMLYRTARNYLQVKAMEEGDTNLRNTDALISRQVERTYNELAALGWNPRH